MDIDFSSEEKRLVDYAKEAIVKYNTIRHENGGIDTLYSFLLSNNGKIYEGASFESNLGNAAICGERHAVANMILQESYKAKIKVLLLRIRFQRYSKKVLRHVERADILYGLMEHRR